MKKVILTILLCVAVSAAFAQRERGFGMVSEVGGSINLEQHRYSSLQLHLSPGYRFNKQLFVGAGAGFNYYTRNYPRDSYDLHVTNANQISAIPLFAHGTYTFNQGNGRFAPFVNLKVGYSIINFTSVLTSLEHGSGSLDYSGGLYYSPAVGIKYRLNNCHALLFSVAYDSQSYRVKGQPIKEYAGVDYINSVYTNKSLAFRLGWEF